MDRIGRYKIVGELGRGAMGVVYHAIDPNIGRPVAIKTIRLTDVSKPDEQKKLRERLFREARSAGMLSHPGIVTIYDVEQQGDLAYIAMEYVDGPTLDHLMSQDQPLSAERFFGILGQTAVALDYAHQKGIVHRDIKPANIMIAADGAAKIADFGIAKIQASDHLTMTGAIVGTPHYMSPEQVQGLPVDGRSDQFSLAVIAFEALTGEKPYAGEHLSTVVYKIVAEEPAPLRRLNPTLGGPIEAVLRRALSKKADARYRNCQEFVEALEKACAANPGWKPLPRGGSASLPTAADVPGPKVAMPPAARPKRAEESGTGTQDGPAKRKSGFGPFLAATLVAAGLLALIGWQVGPWLARTEPPAPSKAPAASQPAAPQPATPEPAAQAAPAQAEDVKPSPMPAPPSPDSQTPALRPASRASLQPVTVITTPGDATATLDGNAETSCATPCTIQAAQGRHELVVTKPGFQPERRDVEVAGSGVELPPIALRAPTGTLMLTTEPAGATVLVNGKSIPQTTPAQLSLAPGTYSITVEKDGKRNTRSVEVRHGVMSYLKFTLE